MERAPVEPARDSFPGSESWVEIGEVVRAHGLDGTVLVQLYGDDPGNLIEVKSVQLRGGPGAVEFRVRDTEVADSNRPRSRVRVSLGAITSREAAQPWLGARLAIPRSALRPLPDGEYYCRDILGLRCRRADTGADLGVVREIWPTGQNDLLVIQSGEETLLVPALREVLKRIDVAKGEVWVEPPPGLLEEGP